MNSADVFLDVSVVLCTYNPRRQILEHTLRGLREQSLDQARWELIIVDNASSENEKPTEELLHGIRNATIIHEAKPGLTNARLCGIRSAKGLILVFVDDDNVLASNYLQVAFELAQKNPAWGAFGGKVIGVFEKPLPQTLRPFEGYLACRNLPIDEFILTKQHLTKTHFGSVAKYLPLGAGLVLVKPAIQQILRVLEQRSQIVFSDRIGKDSLACGADYEMSLILLTTDWNVAYTNQLSLDHLIASFRTSEDYLAKLVFEAKRTWVFLTSIYNVCPWNSIHPSTKWFRMIRSYFKLRAWKGGSERLNWKGSCGVCSAQAELVGFRRCNEHVIRQVAELNHG